MNSSLVQTADIINTGSSNRYGIPKLAQMYKKNTRISTLWGWMYQVTMCSNSCLLGGEILIV